MPYGVAIGSYIDLLAAENQKAFNQIIMDSFVWYPSNFKNGQEFKYWLCFQINEKDSRVVSSIDYEFMRKYEQENDLIENDKASVA